MSGNHVAPWFFIGIGISVGISSGISADGNFNFRRPVFWGDTIAVGVSSDMSAVASIREDKVLTKMKVNSRSEL